MKILILRIGNSCRSQMVHRFLQLFSLNTAKSEGIEASGKLNMQAVEAMKKIDIDISNHTSDPVEKYLNEM